MPNAAERYPIGQYGISRLPHLFKEPMVQCHWTNVYSILSRYQLDSEKTTGVQSAVASSLSCLTELHNDYETSEYNSSGPNQRPVERQLFQQSSSEWVTLMD